MELSTANSLLVRLVAQLKAEEGRRLTDKEVAKRLGITAATLSKWQNGLTHMDQVDTVLKLMGMMSKTRWVTEVSSALEVSGREADPPTS